MIPRLDHPTVRWCAGKLLRLLLVVLAVSALTFLMMDLLPGDAAYDIAGTDATPEDVEALQERLGLNRPTAVRYAEWLWKASAGDFGRSYRTREPVLEAVWNRLPVTLELTVLSILLALSLAVPAGIACAYRHRSGLDKTLNSLAFASLSVPSFVMALLLIYLFSLRLGWFPATGFVPFTVDPWANLQCMALPAVSIALVEWVPLMRVLRSDMIATLREDYILMARSKGLSAGRILFRHALRPSTFTLVTVVGLHIGHLIGGALVVEWIFALPGMGRLLITAIFARDSLLVQGCILFVTVGYVGIHFGVDLLYRVLDPRLRTGSGAWTS